MNLNFGKIFQTMSKDRSMRGVVHVPENSELWPKEWKTVAYKTYKRFSSMPLPETEITVPLSKAVNGRRSEREFGKGSISLEDVAAILYHSCGVTHPSIDPNKSRRAQGSGGARYPIEVYVVNLVPGALDRRLYHYSVKNHSLDVLWNVPEGLEKSLFTYPWAHDATLGIFLTGIPGRSFKKYGERGYRYMYFEAGAISHMMNVVANSLGLGCSQLGGTRDAVVERLLDIDGEEETILLGLVVGTKKDTESRIL